MDPVRKFGKMSCYLQTQTDLYVCCSSDKGMEKMKTVPKFL